MQPVGERVQVGEPGRHAGQRAAPAADRLDLVQRCWHDLGQREVVLADPPVGHPVDLSLGTVKQLVRVAVAGIAELDDPGAHLHQAAQDRPLPHDPRVVPGVRRGRHRGDQCVQVGGAAHPPDVPALGQLGGNGDGVGGLAPAVQVEYHLVHELMSGPVMVVRPDHLEDVRDRVLGQQHAAQHALLRSDVVRGGPLEFPVPRRDLCNAHEMPPPPFAGQQSRSGRAGDHVRCTGRLRQSAGSRSGRPVALCTGLWTACADTPHALCAAWGYDCGNGRAMNSSGASACAYAVHRLCARNSRGRRGNPQTPEVIHTGDLTSYVTCQP